MKQKSTGPIQKVTGPLLPLRDRTILLIFLCVAVEALILFSFQSAGISSDPTSDEKSYNRAALNILDRGTFSTADTSPYEPAVNITPGYPLFLAFVYSISWRSAVPVLILQFLLLGAAASLFYILAARLVPKRAAAIGAMFCATYPPLVFMATFRLTEVLATFLMALFALCMLGFLRDCRRQLTYGLLTGTVAGIAALVRPSSGLLILVPLSACLLRNTSGGLRRRAAMFLLVSVGFMVVVGPWALRNYSLSGRFIPFSTIAGWSIFISAQQYSTERGEFLTGQDWEQIIAEHQARRAQALSAVEDNWVSPAVQQEIILNQSYMADVPQKLRELSLGQVVIGVPYRILSFWSVGDSLIRRFHRIAIVNYVLLGFLVMGGVYLSRKQLSSHWPLWVVPVYLTLIHLVFHAETRYSFPARPFLLVYAGVAVDRILEMARSSRETSRLKAVA